MPVVRASILPIREPRWGRRPGSFGIPMDKERIWAGHDRESATGRGVAFLAP
jgi:hypothetical protein